MVDIDTSGPEVDVTLDEKKDEAVIDTAPEKEETKQETKKAKGIKNQIGRAHV